MKIYFDACAIQGLSIRFTLPEQLPPLRLLLVWDNLAGYKTPEMALLHCPDARS